MKGLNELSPPLFMIRQSSSTMSDVTLSLPVKLEWIRYTCADIRYSDKAVDSQQL